MSYISASRGFKSGTFNTLPMDLPALDPEVIDTYELGVKSELLEGRMRFNAAIFYNDLDQPQIQAQRNGLVFLANAGSARTKGVEFNITGLVTEELTMGLAGAYLEAKYRHFDDVDGNGTSDCATYAYNKAPEAPGSLGQLETSCSGNHMPYGSEWKFNYFVSWDHEIANAGLLSVNLNANWTDKFPWDGDNVIWEDSYTLLDGAIAFTPAHWNELTVRAWMKNMLDEEYQINYYAQASSSAYSSAPGAPRTYGLELIYRM